MTRIFSGIRPSGKLHLGNYLGAIKNWIELQDKNPELCVFMIADYHGITTPFEPKKYGEQILDTACEFLAAGLNPKKILLIRQSQIHQHIELAWIFNTITPISWLDRLPTYKEQLEKTKSNNVGLLDYPVLMAADILIYKANLVPVGEDQLPHIDLTNEILKKINSTFGQTFEPVKAHLAPGARIMSLQDPAKKMSKTEDEGIALTDSPDQIREKIKKAVTDSGREIKFDEKNKPAISNLLTIYSLLSNKQISDFEKEYEGKSYVEFKNGLTETVVSFLKPFQKKYNQFKNNIGEVEKVLEDSEEKARNEAQKTLNEVKQKIGVLSR
ncbi:MAG: tryptophan--tRNA ligase [Parcubacteria group bacterium RIFCSPLOWO2_12_FULL_40_10]|nr:MAG: tryptophan--tRNA ligase [Parcubacteria group bacterium RIFCSPHIGHO2_02_FULL_40_12]OHB22821.1 MAG: tryptophan--tRNA ligase [Parcubacteria group bacterium RIFCSPLOWO2_02_FULL_40_12]OHB24461.1 MAG: tryptophan--tRNA ligase [Parcubacteria group bacterium RIFCSPLOWO2_12_FULL_40_10]